MHFPGLHRSLPINDCYHWCLPTLSFYKLPLITVLFYIPLPGCFFYKECLTQQLKSFKGMPLAKRYTATFHPAPQVTLVVPAHPLMFHYVIYHMQQVMTSRGITGNICHSFYISCDLWFLLLIILYHLPG